MLRASHKHDNEIRGFLRWARGVSGLSNVHGIALAIVIAAAALYSFNLQRTLGASEAYSALAALQPTARQVADTALRLDPGKPVLYHLALHWFSRAFGASETSLRAMSVLFGLASVALTYPLADELFGSATALTAVLIWAFNPLAILFAQWARMYSMFIAFTLAHLLLMAKVRRAPTAARTITCGLLGAAMLYTHMGGALVLAAEGAMVIRDFWLHRKSNSWPAIVIALALFSPFLPFAISQSDALLYGHWLDSIGAPLRDLSVALKLLFTIPIAIAGLWFVFAREAADERAESTRWCAALALLPVLFLIGASVLIRPVFQLRYLAPSWVLIAILAGYALDSLGRRFRRSAVLAIVSLSLALIPICNLHNDPWKDIAHEIENNSNGTEPVVFEAGFFGPNHSIEGPANGFPQGYFRVPFDFYFHAANPRMAVPGSDSARARALIAEELKKRTGLWLVSGKSKPEAMSQLPPDVRLVYEIDYGYVVLLHIKRLQTGFPGPAPEAPRRPLHSHLQVFSGN